MKRGMSTVLTAPAVSALYGPAREAYVKAVGGALAFAAKTELVTPELSLKDIYGGYAFITRDFGDYVITTAQKEP